MTSPAPSSDPPASPTSDPIFNLAEALEADDYGRAKELVEKGADPSGYLTMLAPTMTPVPLLCFFAGRRDEKAVRFLLESGADPDVRDVSQRTALCLLYAREGIDEGEENTPPGKEEDAAVTAISRLLIAHGADVDARGQGGDTPLIHAIARGWDATHAQALLEAGADPARPNYQGDTPVHAACSKPATARLRDLVGRLLDAETEPQRMIGRNHAGKTPLVALLQANDPMTRPDLAEEEWTEQQDSLLGMAQKLLDGGCSPHKPDQVPSLPLYLAVEMQNELLCRLLLEAGADPNQRIFGRLTPFERLLSDEWKPDPHPMHGRGTRSAMLDIFIQYGADAKQKNRYGNTLLHLAVIQHRDDAVAVRWVLDRLVPPIDINARDEKGWTALHWAVRNGRAPACRALVEAGADLCAADDFGRVPADLLFMNKEEISAILRDKAAPDPSPIPEMGM